MMIHRYSKPGVARTLVSGLALLCAFGLTSAALAQSAALSQKAADAAKVVAVAKQKGNVRVIVIFDQPLSAAQTAEAARDPARIEEIKSRVAAARNAILASHFGNAARPAAGAGFSRGLTSFPITPGFAINVTESELESLAADPRVKTIQEDRLDKPTLNESLPLIGMPAAFAEGAVGTRYTVAVLDTGVKSNHEFLAGKVVAEACFSNANGAAPGNGGISLCPNGANNQTGAGAADPNTAQCNAVSGNLCEHGTHVAGIAAGLNTGVSAGEPLTGVAKASKIFAVQVFTRFEDPICSGAGTSAPCALSYTSDQMRGLDHVLANLNPGGFPVASVNMSLGGGSNSGACDGDSRKPSIDNLRSAGVITAIASGNDGFTNAIGAPGCISTAFTVGSTDKFDIISGFSNMSNVVDVMAPGSSINSSIVLNSGSTTSYAFFDGTSMATPHVAGAIAALRSRYPGATAAQIEQALINTGKTIADTRFGGTVSKPRIRMEYATQQAWWVHGIIGTGDFNGDGRSDVLWRRASDGLLIGWLMNGGALLGGVSMGTVPAGWIVAAVADFNGDGTSDLLLRKSDGANAIRLMNGASPGSVLAVGALPALPSSWAVAGVGKFFGAGGNTGILWRNADGQLAIWRINGTTLVGANFVGTPTNIWNVNGVGDFDGDGTTDILLRRNDGFVAIWRIINGFLNASQGVAAMPLQWSIVGVRDVNADNKADIFWRDALTGQVVTWRMNGPVIGGSAVVATLPNDWNVMETGKFNAVNAGLLWRQNNGTVLLQTLNAAGGLASNSNLGVVP